MSIQETIGKELRGFGGYLRCTCCGKKRPLGDAGAKLSRGWPKCCGYTMRWYTQSELDKGMDPFGEALREGVKP